jgi:hypothetical protein
MDHAQITIRTSLSVVIPALLRDFQKVILKLQRLHDAEDYKGEVAMKNQALAVVGAIAPTLGVYIHTKEGRKVAQDVYADLGAAFRELGQLDKMIDMEEELLLMTAQTGDKDAESRTLAHVGMAYSMTGQHALALSKLYKVEVVIAFGR